MKFYLLIYSVLHKDCSILVDYTFEGQHNGVTWHVKAVLELQQRPLCNYYILKLSAF